MLLEKPIAPTLEDCMAVVVDSLDEVREFFEEEGMDASGMSDEELEEIIAVLGIEELSMSKKPRNEFETTLLFSSILSNIHFKSYIPKIKSFLAYSAKVTAEYTFYNPNSRLKLQKNF